MVLFDVDLCVDDACGCLLQLVVGVPLGLVAVRVVAVGIRNNTAFGGVYYLAPGEVACIPDKGILQLSEPFNDFEQALALPLQSLISSLRALRKPVGWGQVVRLDECVVGHLIARPGPLR